MKRFTTILSVILISLSTIAQVNLWRNGYLTSFEKEKFDSLTFGYTTDYDQKALYQSFSGIAPTIENVYASQKQVFCGLSDFGYKRHNDFGYASVCLMKECFGQDLVSPYIGYNWFNNYNYNNNNHDATLTTPQGIANHMIWNTLYKTVIMSNRVIATGASQYEVAQARAMRAHAYMNLAELYQFAYDESTASMQPCVPLVLDSVSPYSVINMPRATVAEVYAQIKADLDAAVEGLKGFERSGKSAVDQAVAFGLRARANLLTHNYEQAASDAMQALSLSGATPLSRAEAGVPGFADAAAKNVIWANIIDEADDVVQTAICNWVSHMSTFYGDGYTGAGATRWIASNLYDEIPETDVRKGWWLNANRQSPLLDAEGYSELKETILGNSSYYPAYTNVKFGTGDGSVSDLGAAAGDWILMRAEEMLLVYAEALQRQGKDGASVLADFVRTYRDPSYELSAHGLSVLDEIWWQRRVELWGEGFSFGDLMRLSKGVTRTNATNWPVAVKQDVSAGDEKLLHPIPQKDEPYRVICAWHSYEYTNNPYMRRFTATDSISFGEAKELTNIYFQTETYTQKMTMQQVAQPHTIQIDILRSHNTKEDLTFDLEVVSASEIFGELNTTVTFPYERHYNDENGDDAIIMEPYISSIFVEIPAITTPGTYSFVLRIPDEYSPYGSTYHINNPEASDCRTFTYTITAYEDPWLKAETKTGVLTDYSLPNVYTSLPVTSFYVNYKCIVNEDGSFKLRIFNPFYVVANGNETPNENGIYPYFPYNEKQDLLAEGNYDINIVVSQDGVATVDDFSLGMAWADGELSIINFRTPAQGTGVLNDKVVFDIDSRQLALCLAGTAHNYAGFSFYFNVDAFLNDQVQIEPVEAEVDSYTGNWKIKRTDFRTGDAADDVLVSVETAE